MDAAPQQSGTLGSGRLAILIIEDDHSTAEALRLLFEFDGFAVSVAGNAVDGLTLARLQHPDAVVCDIGLPGVLTGFDVAALLKSDPATASAFLVAVTARVDAADRIRGGQSGFQACLNKPVTYQMLLEVVKAGVGHAAQ